MLNIIVLLYKSQKLLKENGEGEGDGDDSCATLSKHSLGILRTRTLPIHRTTIMLGVLVAVPILLILVVIIVTDGGVGRAFQRLIKALLAIGCYESRRISHIPEPRRRNGPILRVLKLARPVNIHLSLHLRPRINRQFIIRILRPGRRNI